MADKTQWNKQEQAKYDKEFSSAIADLRGSKYNNPAENPLSVKPKVFKDKKKQAEYDASQKASLKQDIDKLGDIGRDVTKMEESLTPENEASDLAAKESKATEASRRYVYLDGEKYELTPELKKFLDDEYKGFTSQQMSNGRMVRRGNLGEWDAAWKQAMGEADSGNLTLGGFDATGEGSVSYGGDREVGERKRGRLLGTAFDSLGVGAKGKNSYVKGVMINALNKYKTQQNAKNALTPSTSAAVTASQTVAPQTRTETPAQIEARIRAQIAAEKPAETDAEKKAREDAAQAEADKIKSQKEAEEKEAERRKAWDTESKTWGTPYDLYDKILAATYQGDDDFSKRSKEALRWAYRNQPQNFMNFMTNPEKKTFTVRLDDGSVALYTKDDEGGLKIYNPNAKETYGMNTGSENRWSNYSANMERLRDMLTQRNWDWKTFKYQYPQTVPQNKEGGKINRVRTIAAKFQEGGKVDKDGFLISEGGAGRDKVTISDFSNDRFNGGTFAAEMAPVVADLAALALPSVAGTAAGVLGTVGEEINNYRAGRGINLPGAGASLLMDAAGAVPFLGNAARFSKLGKHVPKVLKFLKYAPTVAGGVMTAASAKSLYDKIDKKGFGSLNSDDIMTIVNAMGAATKGVKGLQANSQNKKQIKQQGIDEGTHLRKVEVSDKVKDKLSDDVKANIEGKQLLRAEDGRIIDAETGAQVFNAKEGSKFTTETARTNDAGAKPSWFGRQMQRASPRSMDSAYGQVETAVPTILKNPALSPAAANVAGAARRGGQPVEFEKVYYDRTTGKMTTDPTFKKGEVQDPTRFVEMETPEVGARGDLSSRQAIFGENWLRPSTPWGNRQYDQPTMDMNLVGGAKKQVAVNAQSINESIGLSRTNRPILHDSEKGELTFNQVKGKGDKEHPIAKALEANGREVEVVTVANAKGEKPLEMVYVKEGDKVYTMPAEDFKKRMFKKDGSKVDDFDMKLKEAEKSSAMKDDEYVKDIVKNKKAEIKKQNKKEDDEFNANDARSRQEAKETYDETDKLLKDQEAKFNKESPAKIAEETLKIKKAYTQKYKELEANNPPKGYPGHKTPDEIRKEAKKAAEAARDSSSLKSIRESQKQITESINTNASEYKSKTDKLDAKKQEYTDRTKKRNKTDKTLLRRIEKSVKPKQYKQGGSVSISDMLENSIFNKKW